jgi:hypothetical protein
MAGATISMQALLDQVIKFLFFFLRKRGIEFFFVFIEIG